MIWVGERNSYIRIQYIIHEDLISIKLISSGKNEDAAKEREIF